MFFVTSRNAFQTFRELSIFCAGCRPERRLPTSFGETMEARANPEETELTRENSHVGPSRRKGTFAGRSSLFSKVQRVDFRLHDLFLSFLAIRFEPCYGSVGRHACSNGLRAEG